MGHLFKWVTLARMIALGDFEIIEGQVLCEAQVYISEHNI